MIVKNEDKDAESNQDNQGENEYQCNDSPGGS